MKPDPLEGAGMTRSTHHRIRRIAVGLAVAAVFAPATAQARPMDLSGSDLRSIHQVSIPVVGSEDLAFTRQTASSAASVTADGNGYDTGTGTVAGLVLILGAVGAAVAVHHTRKAKLSPA
jgi:hypothetical protein